MYSIVFFVVLGIIFIIVKIIFGWRKQFAKKNKKKLTYISEKGALKNIYCYLSGNLFFERQFKKIKSMKNSCQNELSVILKGLSSPQKQQPSLTNAVKYLINKCPSRSKSLTKLIQLYSKITDQQQEIDQRNFSAFKSKPTINFSNFTAKF